MTHVTYEMEEPAHPEGAGVTRNTFGIRYRDPNNGDTYLSTPLRRCLVASNAQVRHNFAERVQCTLNLLRINLVRPMYDQVPDPT